MEDLFRSQYRIRTNRLSGRDYSLPGYYFITICSQNRVSYFGGIVGAKSVLNNIGYIINKFWLEIPLHFPFIRLDRYVIMPNHLHAILEITEHLPTRRDAIHRVSLNATNKILYNDQNANNYVPRDFTRPNPKNSTQYIKHQHSDSRDYPANQDAIYRVSTGGITGGNNPMGKNKLGEVVRWFKGRTKFEISRKFKDINFSWQNRFWDRVIRNERELENIRAYILDNPYNWQQDKNYKIKH